MNYLNIKTIFVVRCVLSLTCLTVGLINVILGGLSNTPKLADCVQLCCAVQTEGVSVSTAGSAFVTLFLCVKPVHHAEFALIALDPKDPTQEAIRSGALLVARDRAPIGV